MTSSPSHHFTIAADGTTTCRLGHLVELGTLAEHLHEPDNRAANADSPGAFVR